MVFEIPGGPTDEIVRDDSELILRRNGIPFVKDCQSVNCGRLIVIVELLKAPGQDLFHVSVEYREWVALRRDAAKEPTFAGVWRIDNFGRLKDVQEVRDYSKRLVETFTLDYLRANPMK